MEALLDEEHISDEEFDCFKSTYDEHAENQTLSDQVRFQYAWSLIRRRPRADIEHGIAILEDLCVSGQPDGRRDYLFYLAVANTKLPDYQRALDCVETFLTAEPDNIQAAELKAYIKKKITKDGLVGLALVGGTAAVMSLGIGIALIGGIVTAGYRFSRRFL